MIGLINRRRAAQGGSPALPYDAEVEYLQSNDIQYIDTGFVPDDTSGIYIKCVCIKTRNNAIPVGVRENTSDTRFMINFSNTIELSWNTYLSCGLYSTDLDYEIENNFLNSRLGKVDGEVKRTNYPTLNNITKSVYLFALNQYGHANIFFYGRIKAVKFSRGNSVVMDLIPVRIGQTGYMYDRISGQLFGNSGTGNFIIGNDK